MHTVDGILKNGQK